MNEEDKLIEDAKMFRLKLIKFLKDEKVADDISIAVMTLMIAEHVAEFNMVERPVFIQRFLDLITVHIEKNKWDEKNI